jgi:hypothetical protein
VVSTHHALFFNVLHYELRNHLGGPLKYILKRDRRTAGYLLAEQARDTAQFYHVAALADLWLVAQSGQAKTFHFNILRTILEKTALFPATAIFRRASRRRRTTRTASCTNGSSIS